jgi:hypothetical protein
MDSASIKRVGIEKAHNFMRQFRDEESRELKKLSANQFMEVWSHYDKDGKQRVIFHRKSLPSLPNGGDINHFVESAML